MTLATNSLHEVGVEGAATAIAEGSLSPVDLLRHYLDRIKALDGTLEAWSYLRAEDALAEEAAILEREAREGRLRGPLHGIPVGLKEQFNLAGAPTRTDWKAPNSPVATEDSAAAERLKAAGAIVLGKLYMVGPYTPPTRNPWNLEHTPGGSSSGSGAAVGARLVPAAMSEQTGGSGIRPAAYCGVAGLKATYGRISCYGMHPLSWTHDYACIIGYSIPDVARVYAAIAGYDPRDPGSVDRPAPGPIDYSRPPRIGLVRNFYPELQQDETNEMLERSAETLRGAGANVDDVLFPEDFELAWSSALLVSLGEGAAINAGKGDPRKPPEIAPQKKARRVVSRFARMPSHLGQFIPATYYLHALRVRRHLREELAPLFAQYDALMMATAPGGAPRGLESSGDQSLLLPWSNLGHPAVSIPGGLSAEGMPLGIQLVGGLFEEERLLGAAGWAEQVIGGLPVPEFAR